MLIVDDLLAAPFRGLLWVMKEIVEAAEQESEAEADQIRDELRELYMLLETGQISEDEFDEQEGPLLDRLDELEGDEESDPPPAPVEDERPSAEAPERDD